MSANNELYITKKGKWYYVFNRDVDTGGKFLVLKASNLKEAITRAKIYQKENEVEYGLNLDNNCLKNEK